VLLHFAAAPKFRLPEGAKPSTFFESVDPTPGLPGMNKVKSLYLSNTMA
jgi:hypothetical protein